MLDLMVLKLLLQIFILVYYSIENGTNNNKSTKPFDQGGECWSWYQLGQLWPSLKSLMAINMHALIGGTLRLPNGLVLDHPEHTKKEMDPILLSKPIKGDI